jgi:hypothetical protein
MADMNNSIIPCTSFTTGAFSTNSVLCSSTGTTNMAIGTNCIYTNGWLIVSADLTAYLNTTVKLIVEVGSCVYGGHFQDVFLDTKCSPSPVFASNSLVSVIGNTISMCNVPTATLNVLATNSHTWNGPTGSFASNSNSSVTT